MLHLFNLKAQKTENAQNKTKKNNAALLRVQKDLTDIVLPKTCELYHPDPNDLLNFKLAINPDEGYYKGGHFVFNFSISDGYPHEAPKVKCETRVYHPNIDLEGSVCLNILRSILIFKEPNPDDPLNKDAADLLRNNPRQFELNVHRSIKGRPPFYENDPIYH